ncbi:copper amine oxidase N-terminal domain-containing protein [Paenibacillus koleovorans]|uniref:copper amine oxidase N-terminal domain-containing protein n=1 Tax=Paenibacillus koleovorans TaxID=121608 RepID=UPI000FD9AC49|nr:copper amine oxidase N-terminal domain-containing protein [Paenibacillus koleovorans]
MDQVVSKIKRLCAACVLLMMLQGVSVASSAGAQNNALIEVYFVPMHFVFDGQQLSPPEEQRGFIFNSTTYVPLRFLSYSLDKHVDWNGETYTVRISDPNTMQKVSIHEYKLNRAVNRDIGAFDTSSLASTPIEVYFEQVHYIFDGKSLAPPEESPGMIIEGSLYVPMRFLSESIGKVIEWDSETYTVSVETTGTGEPGTKPGTKPEGPTQPVKSPTPSPSPIPTPSTPTVPQGGGGGIIPTQPTPVKVAYATLISEAESQMAALRNSAESRLSALYAQYKAESDTSRKLAIAAEGYAALLQIDAEFNGVLSALEGRLVANQYETTAVAIYRSQYEAEKEARKAQLLGG